MLKIYHDDNLAIQCIHFGSSRGIAVWLSSVALDMLSDHLARVADGSLHSEIHRICEFVYRKICTNGTFWQPRTTQVHTQIRRTMRVFAPDDVQGHASVGSAWKAALHEQAALQRTRDAKEALCHVFARPAVKTAWFVARVCCISAVLSDVRSSTLLWPAFGSAEEGRGVRATSVLEKGHIGRRR
eukprot:6187668-Pleurochrysis_carterae.AAC.4